MCAIHMHGLAFEANTHYTAETLHLVYSSPGLGMGAGPFACAALLLLVPVMSGLPVLSGDLSQRHRSDCLRCPVAEATTAVLRSGWDIIRVGGMCPAIPQCLEVAVDSAVTTGGTLP
jgi:hypothetical protein